MNESTPKKLPDDVTVKSKSMNLETWNDCPNCLRSWKDEFPTRGILHRTRLCSKCVKG